MLRILANNVFLLFAVATITRSYELDTSYHRFPSFNDLPQPEGSWQEKYNKEQSQYNGVLAASIAAFVATIAYVSSVVQLVFTKNSKQLLFQINNLFIYICLQLKTSEVLFLNWAPPVHWE